MHKLLGLLALLSAITYAGYKAGYNSASVDYLSQSERQQQADKVLHDKEVEGLGTEINTLWEDKEEWKSKAVSLQLKLDNRPTLTIYKEIDNVKSDCTNLGNEFGRVWLLISETE